MKYALATADTEPQIRQLLAAGELHHEDLDPPQLKHFMLAWEGSKPVGVVGLEIKQDCALLRSLTVDAAFRNRKIATRLVSEIEDYAKSMKVRTLFLLTMTAEKFFAGCGYLKTARESAPAGIQQTTEFQNLCPASAVCMVKHLTARIDDKNISLNTEP